MLEVPEPSHLPAPIPLEEHPALRRLAAFRRYWASVFWRTLAETCKFFGWNWQTFVSVPIFFISGIILGFSVVRGELVRDQIITVFIFGLVPVVGWAIVVCLINFFRVPYLLDAQRRVEISNIKAEKDQLTSRLAELTKHNVVIQIDEAASRIYIHTESPTVVRITANIVLRFENKDRSPWTMKSLDMSLWKVGDKEKVHGYLYMRYMCKGHVVARDEFEGMRVPEGEMSKTYNAIGLISLGEEIKQSSDLTPIHYIQLTMQASNQAPIKGMIFVPWSRALEDGGARILYVIGEGIETINKLTDHRVS